MGNLLFSDGYEKELTWSIQARGFVLGVRARLQPRQT